MLLRYGWERAGSLLRAGRGAPDRSATAKNIRLLYWDMAWFGLLFGVSANFLTVFVARLNASPWLLSAITSGPALVNILWQLGALRIVERSQDHRGLVVRYGVPQRFGFLAVAVIPLLLPTEWQAYAIVAAILLQGLPTAVMVVAFTSMFTELVPRDRMAAVVGMRNVLLGLTSTLVVVLAGWILTAMPFPWGYQTIFLIGFFASLASIWCVARLDVEPRATKLPTRGAAVGIRALPALARDRNFVRFAAGAGALQLGMFMTAPLFPLYWVNTLHLGDGWISIFATTLSLTSMIGAFGLRSFVDRLSISRILGAGSVFFALYPAVTSVVTQPWLIAVVAGFAGIWGGVINVALFNALAEVCPPEQRPRYMGVYTWLMNIAIFAGPLVGAALAGVVGVRLALVLAGVVRVLAGAIFLWLPFVSWDRHVAPAAAASTD